MNDPVEGFGFFYKIQVINTQRTLKLAQWSAEQRHGGHGNLIPRNVAVAVDDVREQLRVRPLQLVPNARALGLHRNMNYTTPVRQSHSTNLGFKLKAQHAQVGRSATPVKLVDSCFPVRLACALFGRVLGVAFDID